MTEPHSSPDDQPKTWTVGPGGRFVVLEVIGSGGMGEVRRAVDTFTGSTVAVKFIAAEHVTSTAMQERFDLEVASLIVLRHHNIVRILRHGTTDRGGLFLVMELVQGPSLHAEIADILDGDGRHRHHETVIDAAEAVEIVRQAAAGLEAVHGRKLIHRDVKPANILLDRSGTTLRVVIIDFGIVSLGATGIAGIGGITQPHVPIGSAKYMAPEMWRVAEHRHEHAIGPWTDVYSLTIVLVEMLTGAPPFAGTYEAHRHDPRPALPGLPAKIRGPFEAVVRWGLEPDPTDRIQSVTRLVELLQAALRGIPPKRRPERRFRWRTVPAGAVVVGLAYAVFLGIQYLVTLPADLRIERTVQVEDATVAATVSTPDGARTFVGTAGGALVVLDPSGTAVGEIPLDGPPRAIAVAEDGATVRVTAGSATLTTVDAVTLATDSRVTPAGQGDFTVVGSGGEAEVFVAGTDNAYVLEPGGPGYQSLGLDAAPVAVTSRGDEVYFLVPGAAPDELRIVVLDGPNRQVVRTVDGLPGGGTDIAATSDGVLYVSGPTFVAAVDASGQVSDVPLGGANGVRGTATTGRDLVVATDRRTLLTVRAGSVVRTVALDDGPVLGVTAAPDGCVAVVRDDARIDLLGSGSSCSG